MHHNSKLNSLAVALLLTAALAPPASAALQKFDVNRGRLLQFSGSSPESEYRNSLGLGITLIDDSGASPLLKKLVINNSHISTTVVPSLEGFIFISREELGGPAADQTGTGSAASSVTWGNVTGWTVTGGAFCNAIPSLICALANLVQMETADPVPSSTNFDLGTWVFHGTGFTHPGGYIDFTAPTTIGNHLVFLRGQRNQDGTVSVLPVLGIASVAMSVLALGVTAVRQRR